MVLNNKITHNEVPTAVAEILHRIVAIEEAVKQGAFNDEDGFLNVTQAAEYLDLSKQTIYTLACRRKIPYHKRGKRLYFEKETLAEWVRNGRLDALKEGGLLR